MRITDSHQHFIRKELSARKQRPPEVQRVLVQDYFPGDLRPLLDRVGVQDTVLVQNWSSMENCYDLLQTAEAHDWVIAVVGWVDLTDPELGRTLDELQRHHKFVGVRHQWEDDADPARLVQPDVLRGLKELERRGLRFDVLAKPPNWPYIARLSEALPDLPMVIDHLAKPRIRDGQFDDWAAMMQTAAQNPRMMCKLSGMVTEADRKNWKLADLRPYVEKAIELFGSERVMFGSDWPVCLLASSYAEVFATLMCCIAELSTMERARVLGENARRFYGIG